MSVDISNFPNLALADTPVELRSLPKERLPILCEELREYLLRSVSRSSGHFASGLGTVELTVNLTVANDCLITAPNIAFGSAPVVSAFVPVTSQTINLACTKGSAYTVGLDDGERARSLPQTRGDAERRRDHGEEGKDGHASTRAPCPQRRVLNAISRAECQRVGGSVPGSPAPPS